MRRLHPVSHHEHVVARGEYTYLQDGDPTGTVEEWELTRLPDGSRIYRVEIGGTGLWHLIVAPDGRPDRLQVRLRDDTGRRFDATYTFFDQEVLVSGGQVGKRPEKGAVELPPDCGLVWAPFAGRELALARHDPKAGALQAVTLYLMRQQSPDDGWLSARPARCSVERVGSAVLEVPAGSFGTEEVMFAAPRLTEQRGWFDERGTVVQWQSGEQIQAVLSRYRRLGDV